MLAPYFPADQPTRFSNVHQVFGASNVEEMLNGISPQHRKDAANSLAYEAGMCIVDPINGVFGKILALQEEITETRHDLERIRKKRKNRHEYLEVMREVLRKRRHDLERMRKNPHEYLKEVMREVLRKKQHESLEVMREVRHECLEVMRENQREYLEEMRKNLEVTREFVRQKRKQMAAANVVPAAVVASEASLGHNAATTSSVQMGADKPTEAS